jgi:hypothetical protein
MESFFDQLMIERRDFQQKVIDDRIYIVKKIEQEEWDLILELSRKSVEKNKEKAEKKETKGKTTGAFEKTKKVIDENITDDQRKNKVMAILNEFIESQKKSIQQLQTMNATDSKILSNKDASEDELQEVAENLNELREITFRDLANFHFLTKDNTTEAEWDQIMKSFNKEIDITSH